MWRQPRLMSSALPRSRWRLPRSPRRWFRHGGRIGSWESSAALIRKAEPIENGSIAIDRSGVSLGGDRQWISALQSRAREATQLTTSATACRPVPSTTSSKIATETVGELLRRVLPVQPAREGPSPTSTRPTAWPETPSRAIRPPPHPGAVRCSSAARAGWRPFWPDQIVETPYIPPVVLTQFALRNVPVAPGPGGVLAKSITSTPSLTLTHDHSLFSFEFAALSYVNPQRNQYRYMLEPLDRSWNPVDPKRRIATFTTLPGRKLHAARFRARTIAGCGMKTE